MDKGVGMIFDSSFMYQEVAPYILGSNIDLITHLRYINGGI